MEVNPVAYFEVKNFCCDFQAVPATVDGMLGGFGQLSSTDAASSRRFIQPFMKVS